MPGTPQVVLMSALRYSAYYPVRTQTRGLGLGLGLDVNQGLEA